MTRRWFVASIVLGAAAAALAVPARGQQGPVRFQEHVEVSRVVVDARVVAPSGRPLASLTAAN